MKKNKILTLLLISSCFSYLPACSKKENDVNNSNMIVVDIQSDPATLDPQKSEDSQSHRINNDLFEGLLVSNQNSQRIELIKKSLQIRQNDYPIQT